MNINDITFVITTFKSEKIIFDCINSLPENSHKIVIENSNNHQMKLDLEKKYKNIECHIMEANLGYGRANNYGIKKAKTKYVLILNPDARLNSNTLEGIINILKNQNFCIASPLENNQNDINFSNKNFLDVEYVKGFAMLLNLEKMKFGYFDEQIFLYLEEIDLCKRAKDVGEKILLLNIKIDHAGGFSHGSRDNLEMEKSRNWHWMWSKFYFNKKHYGYFFSLLTISGNLISAILKYFIYFVTFNKHKKTLYKMRLGGLFNAMIGRKSYLRP